jgi:hypothetical protein
MKHFQSAYNFDYHYYYSCDYPGCTKTVNALRRGFLMPSGWFSIGKGESEKHYCLKHYNQIQREKREEGI